MQHGSKPPCGFEMSSSKAPRTCCLPQLHPLLSSSSSTPYETILQGLAVNSLWPCSKILSSTYPGMEHQSGSIPKVLVDMYDLVYYIMLVLLVIIIIKFLHSKLMPCCTFMAALLIGDQFLSSLKLGEGQRNIFRSVSRPCSLEASR